MRPPPGLEPRRNLSRPQVALIVALIALTAALQILIVRAYVGVGGTTTAFSLDAHGIGNLANVERETLQMVVDVEALPRTGDLEGLRTQRALLTRHTTWLETITRDRPQLEPQVPPILEPLAEFDATLAALGEQPTDAALAVAVPVLHDALVRSERAQKALYDQQEQQLFASTAAALSARSRFQRVLLATSVLTLLVAAILVNSLRRKVNADFGLAYDALLHQAYHDSLTGLPNRGAFTNRLAQALEAGDRCDVAVVYIDLDGFKTVNDSLGHQAGDELLIEVARRLEQATRTEDLLARLGGDEFTVLVSGSEDCAEPVAHRVAELLSTPITVAGQEVFVTASVGIAYACLDDGPEALLRNADTAMYEAKERGRACVERFRPELHERAVERLRTASFLRNAIDRDELRVHYQPIVELDTGRYTAVEALVRWEHPERGLVPPAVFIPVAEDSGAITAIDGWVLDRACAEVAGWNADVTADRVIALNVNLSARSLGDRSLVDRVTTALARSSLPPPLLRLEITESAVMDDPAAAAAMLDRLSALGVSLAIDDFGSGYSSLSQLRSYPMSVLKIDKGFVDHITANPRDAAVVSAITKLAHTLGQRVVAEGIETEAQLVRLRQLGCDDGQGYLFCRPLPASQLLPKLRESPSLPGMAGSGQGTTWTPALGR